MNIWILPLLGLSAIAILAGITLSRREDRVREDEWARHYAPNPEPVVQAQPAAYDVVAQAEAVLQVVLRRERR